LTFRARVLLLNAALLVLVVTGILVGTQLVVGNQILRQLGEDLEGTAQAVAREMHANEARLLAEARVVAEEPRLKAVVFTPDVDRATRDDVAADLRRAIGWDLLELDDAVAPPRAPSTGYLVRDGHLLQTAVVPLAMGGRSEGTLLAGTELGDARATALASQTHSDIVFWANERPAATSLDPQARLALLPHPGAAPPGFSGRTVPLGGAFSVMVLQSTESALAPYRGLQRAVVAIGLAALVLAVGLAVFLAQGWSRPIQRLAQLARSVKAGDLDARVEPSGGAELAALASTLNDMVAEVSRQRLRDELARFLVHDLKNPLTSVLGFAQVLQTAADVPAEMQRYAQHVVTAAETMLSMVMDLLDVGSDASGALVPKKSVFDLHELVAEVQRDSAARAQQRNLSVVFDAGGPSHIRADRDLLRRVLGNLLDNAFKYAPKGGRITIAEHSPEEGRLELRVADEGPGIPEAFRARVFEKYFRLERDAANQTRTSRGLGLLFCKVAVEAHGGRIWVEDAKPHGSAFCFDLPSGT
jgi:two-component system sensor histidine kinase/response regulator